jgi:hypothetical protein
MNLHSPYALLEPNNYVVGAIGMDNPPTIAGAFSERGAFYRKVSELAAKLFEEPYSEVFKERQKQLLVGTAILIALSAPLIEVEKLDVEWVKATIKGQHSVLYLALAFCFYALPVFILTAVQEVRRLHYLRNMVVVEMDEMRESVAALGAPQKERFEKYMVLASEQNKILSELEGKEGEERDKVYSKLAVFHDNSGIEVMHDEIMKDQAGINQMLLERMEYLRKPLEKSWVLTR